jgi:hypothetical protein
VGFHIKCALKSRETTMDVQGTRGSDSSGATSLLHPCATRRRHWKWISRYWHGTFRSGPNQITKGLQFE